jgi:hypothetical protein
LQELLEEIAVGGVDLDTVEPRLHRGLASGDIAVDQPADFVGGERARGRCWGAGPVRQRHF